jgi:hypothetical protein
LEKRTFFFNELLNSVNCLIQWKSLNVISLVWVKDDNSNQMR